MKRDNKGNGNLRDVVASCVECRGEVVTDETGIFVRSRDSKALSEEIKEFFQRIINRLVRMHARCRQKNIIGIS